MIKKNYLVNKRVIIIVLLILVICGGFLRLYNLGEQSYWMDEGYTINAVLSILEKGTSVLDSEKYYHCPLYCYPSAFFTKVFGQTAMAYRLFSAIAGIIFILVIFFITKKIFNTKVALLSSFFITFSYWQIAWSRQARWYNLFAVFFWLALYFFYQARHQKHHYKFIWLTAIFLILSIVTHRLGYLLPLIMVGWLLIDLIKNKKWSNNKSLLFTIGSLVIAAVLSELWLKTNLFNAWPSGLGFHYKLPFHLNFYLRNYWLFIFLALLVFFSAKPKLRQKISFFAIPFIIYLICLSFLTDIVHYRYLFHVTPALYILGAVGLIEIWDKIKYNILKLIFILAIFFLFFISGHGILMPQPFYFLEADNPDKLQRPYYAYTPQPDFNQAYGYVKNELQEDEIIISSHPHFNKIFLSQAGYWIQYDYLGFNNQANVIKNDREYYVGAEVIYDLNNLKNVIRNNHGYIIFDHMGNSRFSPEIVDYIESQLDQIFYNEINSYSKIWVFKF